MSRQNSQEQLSDITPIRAFRSKGYFGIPLSHAGLDTRHQLFVHALCFNLPRSEDVSMSSITKGQNSHKDAHEERDSEAHTVRKQTGSSGCPGYGILTAADPTRIRGQQSELLSYER